MLGNADSGRTGRRLAGWTGGIAAASKKAGLAGARFGTVGPVRPGTPNAGPSNERAPSAEASGCRPEGCPPAGAEGTPVAALGTGAPPGP
jgi:hypothetical protein